MDEPEELELDEDEEEEDEDEEEDENFELFEEALELLLLALHGGCRAAAGEPLRSKPRGMIKKNYGLLFLAALIVAIVCNIDKMI